MTETLRLEEELSSLTIWEEQVRRCLVAKRFILRWVAVANGSRVLAESGNIFQGLIFCISSP
jgi:hypothetical protein